MSGFNVPNLQPQQRPEDRRFTHVTELFTVDHSKCTWENETRHQ